MFKRRQYNKGSDFQMTPAGGVYIPSVEAIGSAVGSGISAVVNQLGNPAVLAASQGIATNINKPPKEKPAQLPDYQVAAPRAVDRMSAGTTGAMAVQRMASGVGAHPGGAGRGKGAGGSLGQESRQAMKRKRLSKRIANRKAKGKDQIQLSSDAPKTRDDYDYAEGGRVGYLFGGRAGRAIIKLMSKHKDNIEVKKLSKEIEKERKNLDKLEDKMKSQQDSYTGDTYVDEIGFDNPRNQEDWEYISGNIEELEDNLEEKLLKLEGVGIYNPPREDFQEGGELNAQMTGMMEGPTHTMPDGTVHPGATHEEYEQMLAEGQAEDMAQEGMVPDEQMEEDFVDYVIESTLEPEDTMYLEEALAADPRLSEIFDQVIETASEFSGSGPVEGPGSEVSDSIPARLSDGEFVITSKATEEIGPDNLQGMMEQAEMDADVRREEAEGGYIDDDEDTAMINPMQRTVDVTEREMRKLQLASNPRTQYRTVYG